MGRKKDCTQKPPHVRSQQEGISQNLGFTHKYLNHIETLSWGVAEPLESRQTETHGMVQTLVAFCFSGKEKLSLPVMQGSVSLIKCREYIQHRSTWNVHSLIRQYASAAYFSSTQMWSLPCSTCITYYECEDVKFKDPQWSHVEGRCCAIYQTFPHYVPPG